MSTAFNPNWEQIKFLNRIGELFESGYTDVEIAKLTGLSFVTIEKRRRDWLKYRYPQLTKDKEKDRIKATD